MGLGTQGLVGHGEELGFHPECDGKPLGGFKWENEKIPQLTGAIGQQEVRGAVAVGIRTRDVEHLSPSPTHDLFHPSVCTHLVMGPLPWNIIPSIVGLFELKECGPFGE